MTRPRGYSDNKRHIQADYGPMWSADTDPLQPSHPDDASGSFRKSSSHRSNSAGKSLLGYCARPAGYRCRAAPPLRLH